MLLSFLGGVRSVESKVTGLRRGAWKASVTDPQGLELGMADGSG